MSAIVKSVTSGDTLILSTPEGEKTLSLAFVTAPRLKREGDEVRPQLFHYGILANCMLN